MWPHELYMTRSEGPFAGPLLAGAPGNCLYTHPFATALVVADKCTDEI